MVLSEHLAEVVGMHERLMQLRDQCEDPLVRCSYHSACTQIEELRRVLTENVRRGNGDANSTS